MSITASNNPFPHDPDDNFAKKLDRGGYPLTAQDLKNDIDAIAKPDGFLKIGVINKVGNAVTIDENEFEYRIEQIEVANQAFSTTIVAATAGHRRIDIIVGLKSGSFVKIQGVESVDSPKEPQVPDETIRLTSFNVFGSDISAPTNPIEGTNFVQKSERNSVILTGSGIINQLDLVDEKATIIFKGTITRLNTILYNTIHYNGKPLRLMNLQNTPVTIGHGVSGFGVDFVFPDGQDYVLQPNQTIEFSYDLTYLPYAHHMFIGGVIGNSNIIQDNFYKNTSSRVDLSLVSSNNALSTLTTPTSDGSGQAVHPSVLYFKESWNNYYYWMVITPYNNSNSELENPEILVSNNGVDWIVPPGVTNPLVPSPVNGYSADTELVYDSDKDILWIVWRATIGGIDYVKVMSSSDGVSWTSPVDILTSNTFYYASPAVIYEKGIFTLWWVEVAFTDTVPRVLKYKTSSNMLTGWSETFSCTAAMPSGKDIWHLSMRKLNEEYHAFFHVGTANTDSAVGHELYFATSLDNSTYRLTESPVIRQGPDSNFDKDSIYRGSAIYFPNANKYVFYYSANTFTGGSRKWRIGYTDIFLDRPKVNNFDTISTSQKIHAIHNGLILKIKANVTLTVPFKKLQNDFMCYFDVFTGFTLTLVFETGNTVSGNSSLILTGDKMAVLYKDGSTDSFRLKGDI